MKFLMTYSISEQAWEKAVARFLETGGTTPDGVTLVERLHAAAGRNGVVILESDDATAIYRYAREWSDVCDLTVIPVVNDEQAAAILSDMA